MNERLLELAIEARKYAESRPAYQVAYDKKFAELIVRECAELSVNSRYVNTKSEYYEGFNEALVYVGNKIKQHFGVKE